MICPNCKYETEEDVVRCPQCDNPLNEGKPWEKGAMLKEARGQAEENEAGGNDDPRVRYQHREGGKFARYMKTQEKEWCFQNEATLHVGYCCYTRDPGNIDELKEGTALLSEMALYFGDSEHSLRCGRFDVAIPLELLDYATDAFYRGRKALLLQLKTGERFLLFAMKNKEWAESFGRVAEYRPADKPLRFREGEKAASNSSKGKIIFHLLAALAMFALAGVFRSDTFMMVLLIVFGASFLLLVALGVFGAKKKSD